MSSISNTPREEKTSIGHGSAADDSFIFNETKSSKQAPFEANIEDISKGKKEHISKMPQMEYPYFQMDSNMPFMQPLMMPIPGYQMYCNPHPDMPSYGAPFAFGNQFLQVDPRWAQYQYGFQIPGKQVPVGAKESPSNQTSDTELAPDAGSETSFHSTSIPPSNAGTATETSFANHSSYSANAVNLTMVTTTDEFDTWLKKFCRFLKERNLGHAIPDKSGYTTEVLDHERAYIEQTFNYFVPAKHYAKWFKDLLYVHHLELSDAIMSALSKAEKSASGQDIHDELMNISYDGKMDVFVFKRKLQSLVKKAAEYDIIIPEWIITKRIVDNLKNQFKNVNDFYHSRMGKVSLDDVLVRINYLATEVINKPTPTTSSQSVNCGYCDKAGHTTKRCPDIKALKEFSETSSKASSKTAGKSTSKTSTTSKKRVHHIQTKTPDDAQCLRHNSELEPSLDDYVILDSGEEVSVVKDPKYIFCKNMNPIDKLFGAGNEELPVEASGTMAFKWLNKQSHSIRVLASKAATYNLVSWNALIKAGVIIDTRRSRLINKSDEVLAPLEMIGPYMCIHINHLLLPLGSTQKKSKGKISTSRVHNVSEKIPVEFLHRFFGHVNVKDIRKSVEKGMIQNITADKIDWRGIDKFQCKECLAGKMRRHKHTVGSRLKYQQFFEPFQYIHTDLFGPMSDVSATTPTYFISFVDENTRFRWVYPLRSKSAEHILLVFRKLVNFIRTQFSTKVKAFQMDRGSEYRNELLDDFFIDKGIKSIYNTAADSASNGVAERTNLLFLNDCRTLLKATNLPNNMWYHAVEFATLIRNTMINSSINDSPRAKAGLEGLDIKTILPFGQEVVVHNHDTDSKLKPRGDLGFALCPSKESFGYLIYVPSKHKVIDTTNYAIVKYSAAPVNNQVATVFDSLLSDYNEFVSESHTFADADDHELDHTSLGREDVSSLGGITEGFASGDDQTDEDSTPSQDSSDGVENISVQEITDIAEILDNQAPNKPYSDHLGEGEANDLVEDFPNGHEPSDIEPEIHEVGEPTDSGEGFSDNKKTTQIVPDNIIDDLVDIPVKSNLGGTNKIEILAEDKPLSSLAIHSNKRRIKRKIEFSHDEEHRPTTRRGVHLVHAIKAARYKRPPTNKPSLNFWEAISDNENEDDRKLYLNAYGKEIGQILVRFALYPRNKSFRYPKYVSPDL
ncbi:hypothetical protein KAFR_0B06620 [Kazachstania africana CBS 2517]|uniref:Integrase catalytic domain-containing protein n=1 Tax=Kazachstania africana (strain ATCC 22294 / BCRC 22015 / CBS 2517 / CECT 1963 / NBRC 1671 / NRRL Y-8276) TaxID=1071382 RepID=H2ARF8_KAZAF|nr:hypothetical protein KAFR_0B06620 [Kazachstania africana CBS 2517]CCF56958.1 hypothetical protein KAFR_0B06620 [Kazachstania africana CBS 2517]